MALTSTSTSNPFAAEFAVQSVTANSASKRIFGNQSVIVRSIVMSVGAGEVDYVKMYENANPTIGTTDPDFIFEINASASTERICISGHTANNLSIAAVTAAGTGGTTSPTGGDLVTRVMAGPVS